MKKSRPRPQLVTAPANDGAPVEYDHLRPATAAWLAQIEQDFELESHHRRTLVLAGRQWDTAQRCREVIAVQGETFLDRFRQPKPRPEVDMERQATNAFRLLIRELGLDLPTPGEFRPPRVGGR